jgi:hypothetical protein
MGPSVAIAVIWALVVIAISMAVIATAIVSVVVGNLFDRRVRDSGTLAVRGSNETYRRTMFEKEKDLVALLRKESNGVAVDLNPWPTMREAADEIERLRAEIVRLEAKKQ